MAAAVAATATTSDPCSDQSNQERQQSEATRTPLKDAWDKKLEELRQQWQKQNAATSSQDGTSGQPVQAVIIPDGLKDEVQAMLKDLGPYVDYADEYSKVSAACAGMRDPRDSRNDNKKTNEMKNVCKVLVKTVNWMGNLEKDGRKKTVSTEDESWKQYLRCSVGYEVLLRILMHKYKVEEFMKVIFENMKNGGTQPKESGVTNICSWVKVNDVKDMEDLIGDEVQGWLNKAKTEGGGGHIRGFHNVVAWSRYEEGQEKEKQEKAKQEAKTCKSDRIIDLLQAGMSNKLNVLVDPLAAAKDCIEKAENNGTGNSGNALCKRLECFDDYLQKQTTTPATTTAATGQGEKEKTEHIEDDDDGRELLI